MPASESGTGAGPLYCTSHRRSSATADAPVQRRTSGQPSTAEMEEFLQRTINRRPSQELPTAAASPDGAALSSNPLSSDSLGGLRSSSVTGKTRSAKPTMPLRSQVYEAPSGGDDSYGSSPKNASVTTNSPGKASITTPLDDGPGLAMPFTTEQRKQTLTPARHRPTIVVHEQSGMNVEILKSPQLPETGLISMEVEIADEEDENPPTVLHVDPAVELLRKVKTVLTDTHAGKSLNGSFAGSITTTKRTPERIVAQSMKRMTKLRESIEADPTFSRHLGGSRWSPSQSVTDESFAASASQALFAASTSQSQQPSPTAVSTSINVMRTLHRFFTGVLADLRLTLAEQRHDEDDHEKEMEMLRDELSDVKHELAVAQYENTNLVRRLNAAAQNRQNPMSDDDTGDNSSRELSVGQLEDSTENSSVLPACASRDHASDSSFRQVPSMRTPMNRPRRNSNSTTSISHGASLSSRSPDASTSMKTIPLTSMGRTDRNTHVKKGPLSYKLGNVLGQGAAGVVYLGLIESTGETVAAKEVLFDRDDPKWEKQLKDLQTEISVLRKVEHENCVQYLFTDRVERNEMPGMLIFMEYVSGGSIASILSNFGALPERTAAIFGAQMLLGLRHLHEHHIVHRDIKPANCLLSPFGVVKVADFGAALLKPVEEDLDMSASGSASGSGTKQPVLFLGEAMVGTPLYMAPEVVREEKVTQAADVWSFGCTMMEMLTGRPPWSHIKAGVNAFGVLQIVGGDEDMPLPSELPRDSVLLLEKCLSRDPASRPTTAELLHHTYFANVIEHMPMTPTRRNSDTVHMRPSAMENIGMQIASSSSVNCNMASSGASPRRMSKK